MSISNREKELYYCNGNRHVIGQPYTCMRYASDNVSLNFSYQAIFILSSIL